MENSGELLNELTKNDGREEILPGSILGEASAPEWVKSKRWGNCITGDK